MGMISSLFSSQSGTMSNIPKTDQTSLLGSQFMAPGGGPNSFNLNMGDSGQQGAIFGQAGSNFLNSAPGSQISLNQGAISNANNIAGQYQGLAGSLGGMAGVSQMSPQQQAANDAYSQSLLTQQMGAANQGIGSQTATAERNAMAHGASAFNPLVERSGIQSGAMAGQAAGANVANYNQQNRVNALNGLGGVLAQGTQAQLAGANYQAGVQGAQAGIGQQQAQLGLSGFGIAGQLAGQTAAQNNQNYQAQLGQWGGITQGQQKVGAGLLGGVMNGLGGAGMSMLTGGGGGGAGAGLSEEEGGNAMSGGALAGLLV